MDYARNFGHVVRLKGGDPFVFGRGSEEMEYAEKNGIPAEMIPGISSALAVPALYNIPLTRRNESESFWVITGTGRNGKTGSDLALAAKSTATIVILMGLKKKDEIFSILIREGRSETPVAVIEKGSLPGSGIFTGTPGSMIHNDALNNLAGPSLIVVGEVVKHAKKLNNILENYVESVQP